MSSDERASIRKCIGAIEATVAIESCELPIEFVRSEP